LDARYEYQLQVDIIQKTLTFDAWDLILFADKIEVSIPKE